MSTPIALPPTPAHHADFRMGSDDASYNRHFLGSPMSWRPGSFGAQFVPSQSPTAMLVGSFDPAKSPQDSSIVNAWNVFDRQGELCRNYSCCGTNLPDLHALLEHFEDVHIIVKDRAQPPTIQIPFNPQINPPDSTPGPSTAASQQQSYPGPFDTDEMDLGLDYDNESVASPPPMSTAPTSPGTSRAPSPTPSPTSGQRPALNIALTGVGFPGMHTPTGRSFNAFNNRFGGGQPEPEDASVAPELVYAPESELEEPDIPQSTATSATHSPPAPTAKPSKSNKRSSSSPPSRVSTPAAASTSAAVAALAAANAAALNSASILLPHKPFRCPKPHCSKSYKQANGLKYHMTHGSCSYGPAKDVEAVRALLERKRAAAAAASANTSEDDSPSTPSSAQPTASVSATPAVPAAQQPTTLSQAEINEVEARMRPYACGVGDCARRYKNMNGLRYHYQHSGDHGAVGLGLLAGGLHGCLALKGGSNTGGSAPATPTGNNGTSYAWGSTLLPHIQAVSATNSPTSSRPSTPSTSTAAAANAGKKGKATKAKTEATPFPVNAAATFAVKPTPAAAPAPPAKANVAAAMQRVQAQYQNYQQWYAGVAGASAPSTPTPSPGGQQMQMQVDVTMG
ncbi:hypothetical protein C8F01DRAFT_32293 [Mycena amicta]|nr:hypothetical protein C8F01DRAFT_32293 [Mycena amicta]